MINRQRLAMGNFHYVRYSFDYFLDSVSSLKFRNIELWAAAPHFCLETLDEAFIKTVKSKIEARDLKVICITPEQCSYPVNIAAEDSALRNRSIKNFKIAVDAASELNSKFVLVTAGCGYFDGDEKEAWDVSLNSIRTILRYAEKRNVTLVYEPLSVYASNIVNNAMQLKKMLDCLSSDNIMGMLDFGQMALAGEKISDYINLLGDKLGHVHLLDAKPMGHFALGDGNLPIEEYIDELERYGYKGSYSFEFTALDYRLNPEKADNQSLQWLLRNKKIE